MKRIRFNEPFLTGNERTYIDQVFSAGQFTGGGEFTKECERLIKERLAGCTDVLLTDSCTSALEMCALVMREWGQTQQVILPSYTFSTTASAFARAGYELVFAEVDPHTMMIDVKDVAEKVTANTSAIIAVHYAGQCAEVEALREVCNASSAVLVEDAAQGFDSYMNQHAIGTFGDLSCFSFHETKNIHAGLAGALCVNTDRWQSRLRHIWERGTNRQDVLRGLIDKYSWVEIGGSFYPTELQAAFLRAQLEAVDENTTGRRQLYGEYVQGLSELRNQGKVDFPDIPGDVRTNGHAFFIICESKSECDRIRVGLSKSGIDAYIGYVPLHSSKVGLRLGYRSEDLPITEKYSSRVLRLPIHNSMSVEDVRNVCSEICSMWSQ